MLMHQAVDSKVVPVMLVDRVGTPPDDGLVLSPATQSGARLNNSSILSNLSSLLNRLQPNHCTDIENLIHDFRGLFGDIPTQTPILKHDIVLYNSKPLKQNVYRVNPVKREIMKKEVEYLV